MRLSCGQNRLIGRSGEAQTRGLRIPNAARYQLRYTPIVIKLWSCRWSNLWSNTVLTAFFHLPNRPKSARLKGFRRLSLSYSANTVYAPKAGALPTALHPVISLFYSAGRILPKQARYQLRYTPLYLIFLLCYFCETQHNNPLRFPQKHSRTARLERVALLVVFSPQSFA